MSVTRALTLLATYLAVHLKTMLQYRANFVMGAVSQIVYTLLTVAFVDAFMSPGQSLQGWTFWHVIFLFGFGDISFGLSAVLLFRIFLRFEASYILHGRLDQLLIEPVPVLYALILRNIDLNQVAVVAKGVALMAVAANMLDMEWPSLRLTTLVLLAVCAAAVYSGMYLGFVSLGFWIRRRSSLARPMLSLSYLTQYPLSIYPGPLQFVLTFLLPLGLATFYPAQVFLDISSTQAIVTLQLWMLPALAAVIVAVGVALFHLGLRSYVSSGT